MIGYLVFIHTGVFFMPKVKIKCIRFRITSLKFLIVFNKKINKIAKWLYFSTVGSLLFLMHTIKVFSKNVIAQSSDHKFIKNSPIFIYLFSFCMNFFCFSLSIQWQRKSQSSMLKKRKPLVRILTKLKYVEP